LEAASTIATCVDGVQFVVARAPNLDNSLFSRAGQLSRCIVVEGETDSVLAAADLALTASGTATVQCALHGTPMVVVYRLSPTTYRLGRPFVKVDTYAMVNLIAGERIVPELIQDAFTPSAVASQAVPLLLHPGQASAMKERLAGVRFRLGPPGASRRAAEAIMKVCRERQLQ
jgi:lipid-A-disaccharide synthase